ICLVVFRTGKHHIESAGNSDFERPDKTVSQVTRRLSDAPALLRGSFSRLCYDIMGIEHHWGFAPLNHQSRFNPFDMYEVKTTVMRDPVCKQAEPCIVYY